jgi:hypothetical protein
MENENCEKLLHDCAEKYSSKKKVWKSPLAAEKKKYQKQRFMLRKFFQP